MKKKLTLYVGDQNEYIWIVRLLENWSLQHPEIDFSPESIHTHPAKAVQIQITQLPALIFNGHIVAQGDPTTWMPHLPDQLLSRDGH